MNQWDIETLHSELKTFSKLFQTIRFVDPTLKKVIRYDDNSSMEQETRCFDFWGKNKVCDNCISMRAYHENDTFVKFEYIGDRIYMITAVPIELSDRRAVVELLMDSTNSMMLSAEQNPSSGKTEMHKMIDSMNNLVMKDTLTEIYNRRYLSGKLPVDLLNTSLMEQSLSVIMVDIDHFKNVNDTYGHLTGDCVLKSFAKTLSGCLKRDSDWIARFGGEEFVVCLPGADLKRASGIAEAMRKTVEDSTFDCGSHQLKITASFGVYCTKPDQKQTMDDIIKKADEKLYSAKNNGRNRVEF